MRDTENRIKHIGLPKIYTKNDILFNAGDEATGFFLVQTGEIRVYKMDEEGREVEVVRLLPGDFFGEAIVFASSRFPAFAQAVKDSRVLYFEKESFLQSMEKDPALARFFMVLLAKKCLILNERIEALGLRTVRQRLVQYLLSSCSGSQKCLIELKIKKTDLARILGTVSETLSRNLKFLQDEGLIEVRGKHICVLDCMKLRNELSC